MVKTLYEKFPITKPPFEYHLKHSNGVNNIVRGENENRVELTVICQSTRNQQLCTNYMGISWKNAEYKTTCRYWYHCKKSARVGEGFVRMEEAAGTKIRTNPYYLQKFSFPSPALTKFKDRQLQILGRYGIREFGRPDQLQQHHEFGEEPQDHSS